MKKREESKKPIPNSTILPIAKEEVKRESPDRKPIKG